MTLKNKFFPENIENFFNDLKGPNFDEKNIEILLHSSNKSTNLIINSKKYRKYFNIALRIYIKNNILLACLVEGPDFSSDHYFSFWDSDEMIEPIKPKSNKVDILNDIKKYIPELYEDLGWDE